MKLLIVEDDEDQRKLFSDAIEIFNKSKGTNIQLDEAETLEVGLSKLRSNIYDGAIVDLRLTPDDVSGLGNHILREIKTKLRFPVRVISGHLGDLDPELQIENLLFKCKSRGEHDYDEILEELLDIYSIQITNILNNSGLIEDKITTIFWKHISEILPEFIRIKKVAPDENIEKILLRYISLHLLEYLELSINNNFEPLNSFEFYIKPPIKQIVFTGDILEIKGGNKFGIVLTPACDLATEVGRPPKAQFVTVVIIEDFEAVTNGKNTGDIKKLKSNSLDLKYHFLPDNVLFKGGFINFQNILSVPIGEINDPTKYKIECLVTSPFKKDIIARFSNYYSRQGQPSIT